MSSFLSIIMIIVFFVMLPMILGQLWKDIIIDGGMVFTYLSGFFTILAVIQIIGVPLVYFFVPFHIQVVVYSIVLLSLSVTIIYVNKQFINKIYIHGIADKVKAYFKYLSVYEWLYLVVIIGLIAIELYYALFYDVGNRRSDDGTYIVMSSSAIHDDAFFLTEDVSGKYSHSYSYKYGLCGIYIFYAYASVITHLSVPLVEQTLCAVVFILMANGAFFLISKFLFTKKEDRDNRMIFLIFVNLVFLFGYHSSYSLTFRFLGPIWQGKAIVAVIITPFLLGIFTKLLSEKLDKRRMLFAAMVSLATISLTLGGIAAIGIIPGALAILYLIQTRNVKSLGYLLCLWVFPTINMAFYLINRY